jgi:uncharacterized protein (DUF2164 family)
LANPYQLGEPQLQQLAPRLQHYMAEQLGVEVGGFEARFLLDFLAAELGREIYNKALQDAQADALRLKNRLTSRDRLIAELAHERSPKECPSCRGDAGHESGGPQGWVPDPCTCSLAARLAAAETDRDESLGREMRVGEALDAAQKELVDVTQERDRLREQNEIMRSSLVSIEVYIDSCGEQYQREEIAKHLDLVPWLLEDYSRFVRDTEALMGEIEAYAACGEGIGKAGGYAIQGRAAALIRFISGSYSNIVGLPLFETAQMLRGCGYTL